MTLFLLANGAFIAAFTGLTLMQPSLWVWAPFVALWCFVDAYIVRITNINLSAQPWGPLVAVLALIVVVVLYPNGHV